MRKLTQVITSLLVVVSVLTLNPIVVKADFMADSIQNDNGGIWYREGNSWATGWRQINGSWYYFYPDGYARKGWLKDSNGKWYFLYGDGSMAKDTTIEGYQLGSDGAWVVTTPMASIATTSNATAGNTK